MISVNFWSIITATIVIFIIGSLWYSPILFGDRWSKLIGISDQEMQKMKAKGMVGMWGHYVIQLIFTLITFIVLAFIMNSISVINISNGLFFGFICWLGFVLPIGISGMLWKKQPFELFMIESGNLLVNLIVGGAIIGGWVS